MDTYTCYNCRLEFGGQPNEVSVSPVEIHFYCDTCLHLNLVTSELTDAGFETTVKNGKVIVSLKNRPVNNMEVREVLQERFEDIGFNLQSSGNDISVTV